MRQGRILTLLTDAERLLLVYKTPIIKGALHVYWSALVTMPSCLLLEETALHDGHGIPLLVTKRAPGWGLRETILEAKSAVICIAYSPNSKLIASVSLASDEVQVWDIVTGTSLHIMSVPDAEVNAGSYFTSIAFSPNSQLIASASTDRTVRLWDVVTGSQRHVMRGHASWVRCVAFSPDGTIIVSGSDDGTLRIWDVATGAGRRVMTGHTAGVNSLAFAPDGQTVVSASSDGSLRVWEVLTGTELRVIEGDGGILYCVAFSPDGSTIASGSYGNLQLWSTTNSTRQHSLKVHFDSDQSLAFSPDGRSILSCDAIGLAQIWDVTTGVEKHHLIENVSVVAYAPDGKSIAMGLGNDTIRIWDANISIATHSVPRPYGWPIELIVFSPDGLLIAFQTGYNVRIWDVITGTERHVVEIGNSVCSIAFSPDNRTIACGQSNGAVQVWDVASGSKQSFMIDQHESAVDSVAFSSDGNFVVSCSSCNGVADVRVWDVATGANQHILTRPVDSKKLNMSVAFSADDTVITIRESHEIRAVIGFWDITTAQPKYTESTSPHEQTLATDDFHTSKQHHFKGYRRLAWIFHHVGQEEPTFICWIPQERRGTLAYDGTKVCIGAEDSDGTGTIMILDFSPVEILQHTV
jgi:WD40 repeat protein